MSILLSSTLANDSTSYYALAGSGGSAVSQIVAGSNITLSPSGGTGVVTVGVTPFASEFVRGMIVPFVGTTAPTGWAVCDGTTVGVPDLRGLFIVGTSVSYPFGSSGGAASTALTLNMIPDHIHSAAGTGSQGDNPGGAATTYAQAGNSGGITTPGYTPGTPVPTLPPYYSLTYIMKL